MTPDDRFRKAFLEAADKYGGHHLIPKDELTLMGERMRAEHIVERFGRDPKVLSTYGVPVSIITELCGQEPQIERRIKIADKKRAALAWAADNVGSTVTAAVIAEIGDFSVSTATSLMKEYLDVFRPVKRGFYLIVDPDEERARDRRNA